MALKDLTLAKAELAEKQIEELVGEYIRYDVDDRSIVLMPATAHLSNRCKVLVYLAGIQDWPFITNEAILTDATPAQIGEVLNIPGGTLRPILKELKDSHLLSVRGRYYSVKVAAFPSIKKEILGQGEKHPVSLHTVRKRAPAAKPAPETKERTKKVGRSVSASGEKSGLFDQWIGEGFFNTPRVLRDVQARFHAMGHIVPRTAIPGYLLKAIRDVRLNREKREVDGKLVWVYEAAKTSSR